MADEMTSGLEDMTTETSKIKIEDKKQDQEKKKQTNKKPKAKQNTYSHEASTKVQIQLTSVSSLWEKLC